MNFYAHEKTYELERQRREAASRHPVPRPARRKPVLGPAIAALGGTLRRVGEGLESWANPPAREPRRPFRFDRF